LPAGLRVGEAEPLAANPTSVILSPLFPSRVAHVFWRPRTTMSFSSSRGIECLLLGTLACLLLAASAASPGSSTSFASLAAAVAQEEDQWANLRSADVLTGDDDVCSGSEISVHLLQRKGAHLAASATASASSAQLPLPAGKAPIAAGGARSSVAEAHVHRPSASAASRVAAAVVADELVGQLPAVAVSFMQERIQHASTVGLSHMVHDALFGTFAAQGATVMTSLTAIMLLARCGLLCREKRKVHAEGKDLQDPLDADGECSAGGSKADGLSSLAPAAADAAAAAAAAVLAGVLPPCISPDGSSSAALSPSTAAAAGAAPAGLENLWLCPELVVPRRAKCVIAVPALPPAPRPEAALATPTVARVVTDRVGQPLFRTCVARLPGQRGAAAGAGTEVGHTEQLTIARHDGTCLAECHLHLPAGRDSRKLVECNILQRDGTVFACLKNEKVQVSWLKRVMGRKHTAPEPKDAFNFVSATSPAAWRLSVQGNFAERSLQLVDGMGRNLAAVERSTAFAFDTRGQEFYRLETGSDLDTDMGLVTIVLLAVDRVLSTYSS